MIVLAVMAAGAHSMSITAPALAEQDRLARTADAAAERAMVPNPAATDGLPVPALLGGIVLAFAAGLSGGQVQRRRRAARRTATAEERPAPVPTPTLPARPAPPPPEPVAPAPKPVELATPEPPAPPPPPVPVRSHGPRILRFRAAPAAPPPEPEPAELVSEPEPPDEVVEEPAPEIAKPEPVAEVVAEPVPEIVEPEPVAEVVAEPVPEIVEPEPVAEVVAEPVPEIVEPEPVADQPVAGAPGPLGVAPELPRRDALPPSPDVPVAPLSEAPEALRKGAREPEPVVPASRLARARPWPEEAETLWTCEIAWKAGYLKSTFRAMAGAPGAGRRKSIAESPTLRWTLMTDPEPPTPEMIASVKVLVSALVAAGWESTDSGAAWYTQRFIWRGSGEPAALAVPDVVEPAEPPAR